MTLATQLDADGPTGQALHIEAHQGLVHGANLLHIERAVGEPLAVQDDQLFQHAVDGAITDGREIDCGPRFRAAHRGASSAPPFQKGIDVGVKQPTVARGQVQVSVGHSQVHGAEQADQARVGAKAPIHAVRVAPAVLLQLIVEPKDAVVLGKELTLYREQATVLAVEGKDQAQENGQKPRVKIALFPFF